MRLLYITPYVPSPIRVRPYELLRALVGQGIQPRVLCPASSADGPALTALRSAGIDVDAVPVTAPQLVGAVVRHAASVPLQAAYGLPAPLVRRLSQILMEQPIDLVHIEHLRAAALLPLVRRYPVVYDAVDCISLLQERTLAQGPDWRSRLLARLELGRTRSFERRTCRAARLTAVTSLEDAAALRQLAPDADIRLVPNGVDLTRFAPGALERRDDVVVFTGKMSYHANVAAAVRLIEQIMPRVWRHHPSAQAWIVGSSPPPAITRYAADPRVTVTGYVPEMVPYLQQATVAVSPLRYGVGVQNKVLEAMATATPTVTDRQCMAALQAQPERDLLVADDDVQFAAAIARLLDDAALRRSIGQAGRAYVERHHRWTASAALLAQMYHQTLQTTHPTPAFAAHQPRHMLP